MKLSYRLTGSGGVYQVLVDQGAAGNASFPMDYAPRFQATTMLQPLYQQNRQFRSPQGGVRGTLPVTLDVAYGDVKTAMGSVKTIAALIGLTQLFHLKVEEGGDVSYYPNAVLQDYQATVTGVSVRHSMQFDSDVVTGTEPT